MRHVDLLLARSDIGSLDEFARLFFEIVGIESFQERQSDHYVEGRYFTGAKDAMTYTVMLADDEDHADLPYWVQVSSGGQGISASEVADALASRCVREHRLSAARIEDFGRVNEKRFDYSSSS